MGGRIQNPGVRSSGEKAAAASDTDEGDGAFDPPILRNADPLPLKCGTKDCGWAVLGRDFALMAAGGYQKQVSSLKMAGTERDVSGHNLKNRELGLAVGLAALIQKPSVNPEPLASCQGFCFTLAQSRFEIAEINAFERLLNVEFSWLAVVVEPVPIKHAIRCVAVLLYLEHHVSGADSV